MSEREQEPSEAPPLTVTVSVDTSAAIEGLWKARAGLLFGWHPELQSLDDELDIMYRGQL